MAKKKNIMILDVETNHEQKVFDLSFLIGDLYGNILLTRQYVIVEVYPEQLFWEEKRPDYEKVLADKSHPARMATVADAFESMGKIIDIFNIKTVYAYNASFDTRTLNNLAKEFKVDNPLNNLEIDCLWFWSVQTLFQQKSFYKWADKNFEYTMTEKGNYKTSAEMAYAYITKEPHFEEVHRGIEDCFIEYQIFLHCRKQKKLRAKGICSNAWILAQKNEQIEKLPKRFQTMKLNLESQISQVSKVVKKLNKNLTLEIEPI